MRSLVIKLNVVEFLTSVLVLLDAMDEFEEVLDIPSGEDSKSVKTANIEFRESS